MAKKIVIVAPSDAGSDVDDAVKLLKGAGYDVDIEEPTPKALLHIVLGLMGPNAYGFGADYAYAPGAASPDPAADDTDADADADSGADADAAADDAGADDAGGDDDFNFESLGTVSVDGELIEAVTHDSDTSVLCVEGLNVGAKTVYSLNESRFTFFPADVAKPASRVDIIVEKHRTSLEIPVQEAEGKPTLKVGKDLRDMFEASKDDDDDDISVKVGQHVKNIQPMRAGKAYASFGSPAKIGDEGKVTKVNNLHDVVIVQFKKNDGSEVYTHVQNLKR